MGQVDLPQIPPVSCTPKKVVAEDIPAKLDDCQSPFSQWELPCSFFPTANSDQKSVHPTEMQRIPTFIPDATHMQPPYVTDSDQAILYPIEAPALVPDAIALQQQYLPPSMPCVYMVPMVVPQQHVELQQLGVSDFSFPLGQDDVFASTMDFAQSNNLEIDEADRGDALALTSDYAEAGSEAGKDGDADHYAVAGVETRLSASASRRRRRQRAAAARAQEQYNKSSAAKDSWHHKTSYAEDHNKSYAEMLAQLNAGGQGPHAFFSEILAHKGAIRHLAFDAEGCRIVQLALQKADHKEATSLCAELHGCVRSAIGSPHCNYVMQKIVEQMPAELSSFVSSELLGSGAEVSRHRFGCRVMCRLSEHSSSLPMTSQLIKETLQEASDLCCHGFGHHVMESILEHGSADQRHKIALTLQDDIFRYATNAHATYVIESALRHCSLADRRALAASFLLDTEYLLWLAEHASGFHVVKALLKYAEQRSSIAACLQEGKSRLQASEHGNRILCLSYHYA